MVLECAKLSASVFGWFPGCCYLVARVMLGCSVWFLSIWCDVKSVDVPQVPPSMRVYGILFYFYVFTW